jgi:thioredoxin reductase/NAD-dependent dihydropyrimidine dehydrogenase PreA subunit
MAALEPRALIEQRAPLAARRRSAPTLDRTSDVTRPRGWLYGSLAGALGLLLALAIDLGSRGDDLQLGPRRSYGRAHALAGLTCASCHRSGEDQVQLDPASACHECHANKRSVRVPHAKQIVAGTLQCITCHPIHHAMGGVGFVPSSAPLRFRDGVEVELDAGPSSAASFAPTSVVLVEVAACANCHRVARDDDPMAHCRLGDRHGATDPVVCFDEHQTLASAAASERASLWELAREAAAVELPVGTIESPPPPLGRMGLWLGLSLGFAGLGLLGRRAWARRHDRLELAVLGRSKSELPDEREVQASKPDPASALRPAERRRLPTVDTTTCIGCSACVDACPYDVLDIRNYVAVVARPNDCCGLTLCEQRCPNGSLVIHEGERLPDLPRIDDRLEALDAPGVHLAGDITGLPLIRNAINQGAHAVQAIAPLLRSAPRVDYELIIVGAGPAGISAALEAKRLGIRYLVLEQASAAESIRSFPRGKLVFDQPLGMPMVGDLWLRESTKEELLGKWLRIIRSEALAIREGVQVRSVERPTPGVLHVISSTGERFACARVLLAFGRRGTPRKLDVAIPDAMLDHVHYALADARSFAGRRVLIVGLGDVAMEAAIGLAAQANTKVLISYRGGEASRGKRRNVDELARLARKGRVELLLRTEVDAIEPGRVRLRGPSGVTEREVDSVLVMIGSVPPKGLLDAFGVTTSESEPSDQRA